LVKSEPQGVIEALVNVTNIVDKQADNILPGAWEPAIKDPRNVRVTRDHKHTATDTIGKVLELRELRPGDRLLPDDLRLQNAGALWARAQFNMDKAIAREAYSDIANGYVKEWSVSFSVALDDDGEPDFDVRDGVRYIPRIARLDEFSAVFFGASPGTRTTAVKCIGCTAPDELEQDLDRAFRALDGVKPRAGSKVVEDSRERLIAKHQAALPAGVVNLGGH
jgi:HK97 family phage prohead protease